MTGPGGPWSGRGRTRNLETGQFGPPREALALSPVHQHEVILQERTLRVGPHHTHQAAGVQLLVLVKGMGQLVHSLTREEGKKERSGLRAEDESPGRTLPMLLGTPGPAPRRCGLLLPHLLSFRTEKPRAASCQQETTTPHSPSKLLSWMLS